MPDLILTFYIGFFTLLLSGSFVFHVSPLPSISFFICEGIPALDLILCLVEKLDVRSIWQTDMRDYTFYLAACTPPPPELILAVGLLSTPPICFILSGCW